MIERVHVSEEQLREYGMGQLTADGSTVVEVHLATCVECRDRVASLSGDHFVKRLQLAVVDAPTRKPDGVDSNSAASDVPRSTVEFHPATNVPPELLELHDYTDIRELDKGGMGVVYLAKNITMDRDEVLKVVNKTLLERSGSLERFTREIRAAAKLNHPNVVTAYSSKLVGEMLVLSMEYVAGQNLSKVVKDDGPLTIAKACYYVLQAARGLQHAHDRGLVHRDIKPSNMMLVRDGKRLTVKVLDFGLAKSMNKASLQGEITGSGTMLGTPTYMAPEQIRNSSTVDIRADIYALGCTLFYLLTGKPPFIADTIVGVLFAHVNDAPPVLHDLRADVPNALSAVAAKMLAKDPAARYQTPEEVVKALTPFVRRPNTTDAAATVDTLGPRETEELSGTIPLELEPPLEVSTPRRSRWLLRGVAVLVLAGLIAGGVVLRLPTPNGTIELTNLADDAVVQVDGEIVKVTWAAGKESASIRVRTGTHQLEIKQGDTTIVSQAITIEQAGVEKVSAKVVPSKVVAAKTDEKPKAEKKPDDAKPAALIPATNRVARQRGRGKWSIENGILTGKSNSSALVFGDLAWTDYDFEFEYRVVTGPPEIGAAIRQGNGSGGVGFKIGTVSGTIDLWQSGDTKPIDWSRKRLPVRDWHRVVIEIRGSRVQCFVGHAALPQGEPVIRRMVKVGDKGHVEFGIGYPDQSYAAEIQFRNVEVRDKNGGILWSGLPELSK